MKLTFSALSLLVGSCDLLNCNRNDHTVLNLTLNPSVCIPLKPVIEGRIILILSEGSRRIGLLLVALTVALGEPFVNLSLHSYLVPVFHTVANILQNLTQFF